MRYIFNICHLRFRVTTFKGAEVDYYTVNILQSQARSKVNSATNYIFKQF
jgi:hypothetical protein